MHDPYQRPRGRARASAPPARFDAEHDTEPDVEPAGAALRPRERQRRRRSRKTIARDTLIGATAAAILAVGGHTFVAQPFYIPSESMASTLNVGDRIIVNKLVSIARGDIVVFEDPGGWTADENNLLVKRLIGLPGDHVQSVDGVLSVNGAIVTEPYLADVELDASMNFNTLVPEGMLWVMGDNRGNSADSRYQQLEGNHGGFVPVEAVKGSAFLLFSGANGISVIPSEERTFGHVPEPSWDAPKR